MKLDKYTIVAELENFLTKHKVPTKNGYFVVPSNMLIRKFPAEILPHPNRNKAINPTQTLISNFSNDEILFGSMKDIDERLEIWSNFMGISGFDFSARKGDDENNQNFYLYLNKLLDAYAAFHGIHIFPNFRIGGEVTSMKILNLYPPKSWFIAGTLGCANGHVFENEVLLKQKLLFTRPGGLAIYGLLRNEYKAILDDSGVNYRVYKDFRSSSWDKSRQRRESETISESEIFTSVSL